MLLQTTSTNCLIDAGDVGSAPAILRRLRAAGVRSIDLAVLTHPHTDHIGGLQDIGRRLPVRHILDSGFPLGSGVQRRLLDWVRKERIPYHRAVAGQRVRLEPGLTMDVLWPRAQHLRGTESDANNNSVVLRVSYGKIHILAAGDLQSEAEIRLLESSASIESDVLKVGHQGSADATSDAFLSRVRPRIALIAVGRRNAYGHPSAETLGRLLRRGAEVYRTDRDGDIRLETDGARVWVAR